MFSRRYADKHCCPNGTECQYKDCKFIGTTATVIRNSRIALDLIIVLDYSVISMEIYIIGDYHAIN